MKTEDGELVPLEEWTYQPTIMESLQDEEQVTWTEMADREANNR